MQISGGSIQGSSEPDGQAQQLQEPNLSIQGSASSTTTHATQLQEPNLSRQGSAPSTHKELKTVPRRTSDMLRVGTVSGTSVEVRYQGLTGDAQMQIVDAAGTRFDAGAYAGTLTHGPEGALEIPFSDCPPVGDYRIRLVALLPQEVAPGEIPFSKQGDIIAQSEPFHYPGSPMQTVCDAVARHDQAAMQKAIEQLPEPPSCTIDVNKPLFVMGDTIIVSWTSKNANYAKIQDRGDPALKGLLPSGTLATTGSFSFKPPVPGGYVVGLKVFSDVGTGTCITSTEYDMRRIQ